MGRFILAVANWLLRVCGRPYALAVHRTYPFKPGVDHTMPSEHTITMHVVYTPRETVHDIARQAFERDGVPFAPAYRYTGFFDYKTRTLYCEKWDAAIAGHELFHATDGDWHA